MRKILCILILAALMLMLTTGASAATSASEISVFATVSSDGSCQLTATATLHLEQAGDSLHFPVPREATGITLNGARARVSSGSDAKLVDLSRLLGNVAGDFSINVSYTLNNVIHTTENQTLELRLPMLAGFAYPVQALRFSVTLPGENTAKPAFISGYHQASIEQSLSFSASGNTVSGYSLNTLKDHETLTMTLPVTAQMFPQTVVELPTSQADDIAMIVCAVLALLYWLLFLRCAPPRRTTTPDPVEGYSAGCMGSILCLQGTDLTMLAFSWAQLGYLLIQQERSGRVVLHKRMDMGNERPGFERRLFQALFAKRQTVDTSSLFYAQLCRKASIAAGCLPFLVQKRSGNRTIFRVLTALIGVGAGVSLGLSLSGGAALQGLWVVLLGIAGGISSWFIQPWAGELFLFGKRRLSLSLTLCSVWLILGLIAGEVHIAALCVAAQLLAGLMYAFGGRRTELGRQYMSQALGLRRYLCRVSAQELQRITEANPEYFHGLAPYALALGADKRFAARFGSTRLPACPYLTTGMDGHMTAAEWSRLMRSTAAAMNRRAEQLATERLAGFIRSLIK